MTDNYRTDEEKIDKLMKLIPGLQYRHASSWFPLGSVEPEPGSSYYAQIHNAARAIELGLDLTPLWKALQEGE